MCDIAFSVRVSCLCTHHGGRICRYARPARLALSCSHAGPCMLMACSKIMCMHAHALVMHSNNRICWHSNFQLLLPSTWILKGNQPGPWKGINLDLGWGSTWTRDWLMETWPGAWLNLDQGQGSTWIWMGPIPESLVALCH